MLALVKKMTDRVNADKLPRDAELAVRARELQDAYERRFLCVPPDMLPHQFVDVYVRAYAAWHVYSGEV